MEQLSEVLHFEIAGNSILRYCISLTIFLVTLIILTIFKKIVWRRVKIWSKETENKLDDYFLVVLEKTLIPLFYISAIFFAVKVLTLPENVDSAVSIAFKIVLIVQAMRFLLAVVVLLLQHTWLKTESSTSTASKSILTVLKILVWGFTIVFLLDNLGFDVNSVVAGLGIGGVAVALAAQTILGDLFNYFVIFFDKPFKEGDFVIIDDMMGVIDHIGIKTTRIRSLGGEQLVFSNTDLTSSRLKNYKRMIQRRVLFRLGVEYQTSLEKMKKIPGMIKKIIEEIKDTTFDRAHFCEYGDFSLNVEIVYYIFGNDYNKYMDIQEEINLKILGAFEKEQIGFAYPTQTLYVNKNNA